MSLRIRQYQPSDLAEVVAMWHASKRAAFSYVPVQQSYTLEDDGGYFQDVLARECDIWLAEIDGQVVGFLAQRGNLMDQLFVDIDKQGQGVGTALLDKARELSPAGLRAYTFQKNTEARSFYEKHGFRVKKYGVSDLPENEPDVLYEWLAGG